MGRDVRLVKRRGMQHGPDPAQAVREKRAIGDRADTIRPRRALQIDPHRRPGTRAQRSHERFAEMSRTACDQYRHRLTEPPSACALDAGPIKSQRLPYKSANTATVP